MNVLRRVIVIAALFFTVSVAQAQEPILFGQPNQGVITAGQYYAGSLNGPVVVSWTFFSDAWTGLVPPLDAGEAQVTAAIQQYVLGSGILAIFVLYVLAWTLTQLWYPASPAAVALGTVGTLMRFTTVMVIVGDLEHLNTWIVAPLKGTPAGILAAIGGVGGGEPITGNPGALYDKIFSLMMRADLATIDHAAGILQTIEVCIYVGLAAVTEVILLGLAALVYLLAYALLDVILSLAPIMVFLGAFRQTRHLLAGWVGGCVSLIATVVIANIILQIGVVAMHAVIDPVAAAPANANVSGMLMSILQTVAISVILVGCMLQSRQIAVGMFSGIMAGFEHFAAAAAPVASSVSAMAAGYMAATAVGTSGVTGELGNGPVNAAGGASGGAAATANAGRSLSGAGPGVPGMGARP